MTQDSRKSALVTEEAIGVLLTATRSDRHTVQYMGPPFGQERYEVIYAGKPPDFDDEDSGALEATVFVESDGSLRLAREKSRHVA